MEEKERLYKPWATSVIIKVLGIRVGYEYLLFKLQSLSQIFEDVRLMQIFCYLGYTTWLPLEYYDTKLLCKVGDQLGSILKIYMHSHDVLSGEYVRICVQVNIEETLKTVVYIGHYPQRLNPVCFSCGKMGIQIMYALIII